MLPRLLGVEVGERREPQSEDELEPLVALLEALEGNVSALAARFRIALRSKETDTNTVRHVDAAIGQLRHRLHGIQRLKTRQTWHIEQESGDDAEAWLGMYTGRHRRFKSLHSISRRVQVESRVVQHWRNHTDAPERLGRTAREDMPIDAWDRVNVFDLEKEFRQPLTRVFMAIWTQRDLGLLCRARETKVKELVEAIEGRYKPNPYHNRMHAADVTLAAYYLWSRLAANPAWSNYFTETDLLVLLVAAAVHDAGHPAVNNDFLVTTRDELALLYNDRSVLENYSSALAFKLMQDVGTQPLELNLPSPPVVSLRVRVVDMVLATDMAHHRQGINELAYEIEGNNQMWSIDKLVLEKSILRMADIAHPLRPNAQHREWSSRVTQEFWAQGDQEKALGLQPMSLFDRHKSPSLAKSQLGFFNFVVSPLWSTLCRVFSEEATERLRHHFERNRAEWEALASAEDADIVRM